MRFAGGAGGRAAAHREALRSRGEAAPAERDAGLSGVAWGGGGAGAGRRHGAGQTSGLAGSWAGAEGCSTAGAALWTAVPRAFALAGGPCALAWAAPWAAAALVGGFFVAGLEEGRDSSRFFSSFSMYLASSMFGSSTWRSVVGTFFLVTASCCWRSCWPSSKACR